MWGIELADGTTAARVVTQALAQGVILLQAGPEGNVLSITPPLVISERQLYRAMDQLERLQRQRRGETVPPPLNINLGRGR